jgi:hypothetical protein
MPASEVLSYSRGGDRDDGEFQVYVDLDQEGYQYGRIFSDDLRDRHSVFSTTRDVSYGWNREHDEDSDFGKYVPDYGLYRPGPWSANPMPKWIDPDEFALSYPTMCDYSQCHRLEHGRGGQVVLKDSFTEMKEPVGCT